ncbi:MAG: galactose oxidase, partial [Acidobacteriota bacterium]
DRVHVFGGYAVAADGRETTSPAVDIYDVRERRYTSGAPMPVPVDDTVSGVWRSRLIFLVSGWSMSDNVANVQAYDPAADRGIAATPIPGTPVFGHAGGVTGDVIVYCGGAKVQAPKTPKYAPSAECWRGDIAPSTPTRIAWRQISPHPGAPRYRAAAVP